MVTTPDIGVWQNPASSAQSSVRHIDEHGAETWFGERTDDLFLVPNFVANEERGSTSAYFASVAKTFFTGVVLASPLFMGGGAQAGVTSTTPPSAIARLRPTWDTHLVSNAAAEQTRVSDEIIGELGRLQDGWAGDGSVAPPENVRRDVEAFLGVLTLTEKNAPSVEVDDETGNVTFFWMIDFQQLISVDFFGDGHARCAYSNRDASKSFRARIHLNDDRELVSFLTSDEIVDLGVAVL